MAFELKDYVPEDKLEAAQAAYDADIKGLKDNKDAILAENVQLKKEAQAQALKIATAEQEAEVLRAEKEGSGADLLLAQQNLQAAKDEHEAAIKLINSEYAQKEATSEFLKAFKPDEMTQMYMASKFNESVEFADGVLKPKDASLTMEQLKDNFVKDEKYSGNVIVNLGSGGGAQGGQGGFNKVKSPKEMNEQERAEFKASDPAGFKLAFNL